MYLYIGAAAGRLFFKKHFVFDKNSLTLSITWSIIITVIITIINKEEMI